MFVHITKTDAWLQLMDLIAEQASANRGESCGIVVRSDGHGLFVLHNCWRMEPIPGYTRLIRRASTGEKGVIFEPLDSLLEAIKKSGWGT